MTDFWQGKKVVIAGGAGFVGSHLTRLLLDAGAKVKVIDDLSRGHNTDTESVHYTFDAAPASMSLMGSFALFNLAATVAGVRYNQDHHLEMFRSNLITLNRYVMLAERANIPHFLQVSSVCVYGEDANHPCLEDRLGGDPTPANAGYSWAKRMGEKIAQWSSLPHAVIVRPSNIFGPRDYFDERAHVIPALIKKCLEDDPIRVYGTGDERREFIYVSDVARGMMAALEHGGHKQVYNIGTDGDTSISIRLLVKTIQELTGTTAKRVEFTGGESGDLARWSDCDRAHTQLGWQHQVTLREGLEKTIEWYRAK